MLGGAPIASHGPQDRLFALTPIDKAHSATDVLHDASRDRFI
jgi:hypothetical protein